MSRKKILQRISFWCVFALVFLAITARTHAENPGGMMIPPRAHLISEREIPGDYGVSTEVAVHDVSGRTPLPHQPVQIHLPGEARFAFALGTHFMDSKPGSQIVGLSVGTPYRFRIDNIPYNEGRELYPTLRILRKMNPPPGKELEFPIVVEFTQEDLELALQGKMITRIVYLECPFTAAPVRSDEVPISQDVAPDVNPMVIAQTLGEPVAVARIGTRVPDWNDPDPAFFYGSPPWVDYSGKIGVVMDPRLQQSDTIHSRSVPLRAIPTPVFDSPEFSPRKINAMRTATRVDY